MDWIFVKFAKTLFLGHFDPFLPKNGEIGFFPKNRASSLFRIYGSLTSCKKSEKSYDPILRKRWDGQTDGETDKSRSIGHSR